MDDSRWKRALMAPLANYLRLWDYARRRGWTNSSPTAKTSARRIWRLLPARVAGDLSAGRGRNVLLETAEDYYLDRLRAGAVQADRCRRAAVFAKRTEAAHRGRRSGISQSQDAWPGPNVEFCGRVSDDELRELYARCRAFLMPGEEDFGITPVEALASGKPVIALGRGGVLESAPPEDRLGGIFYPEPEEQALETAIGRFEKVESGIAPGDLQASVARFSESRFLAQMSRVVRAQKPTSRPFPSTPPVSCAAES